MAKMFYTLEEAAEKLGVTPDEVKKMGEDGTLQQFRDKNTLHFKREHVDELLSKSRTTKMRKDEITLDDEDDIKLSDDLDTRASKTDSIDLMAETAPAGRTVPGKAPETPGKSRTATGISVFDADEIEAADPMAQTQVTSGFAMDQDLTLDSVGSGSGLLDLTRESDETSLGAVELLEEGEEKGGTALGGMPSSSTGIFDQAGGPESAPAMAEMEVAEPVYVVDDEGGDPAGDGFGGGMMIGVFITLVIATIILVTGMQGNITELTAFFAADGKAWMYAAGLGVLSLVLGIIGFMIGKGSARTA